MLAQHVEHVRSNLAEPLQELEGVVLVCDCTHFASRQAVLVIEALAPDARRALPQRYWTAS